MRKVAALVASTFLIAACQDSPVGVDPESGGATLSGAGDPSAQVIPGRYIVVLKGKAGAVSAAQALASRYNASVSHVYSTALNGFAAGMSAADAARLARDPGVAFVEPDGYAYAFGTQSPTPSWGLDRIDQINLPLNNSYTYPNDGAGVNVYIIDTGIRVAHNDFGGRAFDGYDAIDGSLPAADCNGHGTHVAGTAGGTSYGVAKGAKLYAVRVLDCNGSGTYAQVIAGVDWVAANRVLPAVANMSLGGSTSTALDNAVRNAITAGVLFTLAAGNGNFLGIPQDACTTSPARVLEGITVAASTITDARASFSNFGTCVDIFAPGVNITSAWSTSNTATSTISGTSMAAPHVAGAAALYLAANPGSTPAQVGTALTSNASANKISNPGTGTPNKLLYVGFIGGGPPPPPVDAPPVASFTHKCRARDHRCDFDSNKSSDDVGIVSRTYDFGDGTTLTNNTRWATRVYASAGTYTVKLTVMDTDGQTGSVSRVINVP
ncbi:MAG: S8 family serine peptidase [Gemmatimonadota bacterium]|nr:S8 family serine peptidase [Gemmatimonadota bacterium]